MNKKSFTDFEKVLLVLASIRDDVVITDFCTRHGIARSSLYAWRKALLRDLSPSVSVKNLHRRAG
jgi:transposase-like protein